jgi:hypothetical protein
MSKSTKEVRSFSLDKDVVKAAEEYAEVSRMTLSAWVNNLIAKATGLLHGDLDSRNDDE